MNSDPIKVMKYISILLIFYFVFVSLWLFTIIVNLRQKLKWHWSHLPLGRLWGSLVLPRGGGVFIYILRRKESESEYLIEMHSDGFVSVICSHFGGKKKKRNGFGKRLNLYHLFELLHLNFTGVSVVIRNYSCCCSCTTVSVLRFIYNALSD